MCHLEGHNTSHLLQGACCRTACTRGLCEVASCSYLIRQQKLLRGMPGFRICSSAARMQSACCSAASVTSLRRPPASCNIAYSLMSAEPDGTHDDCTYVGGHGSYWMWYQPHLDILFERAPYTLQTLLHVSLTILEEVQVMPCSRDQGVFAKSC